MTPEDEDVWTNRAEKASHSFTVHPVRTVIKWGLIVVLCFGLLSACFAVVGYFAGWFRTAEQVVSPQHVRDLYYLSFQDYNSLKSTAQNVCEVQAAEKGLIPGSDAMNQRETEVLAYQTNYNRIAAQFNARNENIFEAKHIRPTEIPMNAPSLTDMEAIVCG